MASLLSLQVDQKAAYAALARLRVGQPMKPFKMTQRGHRPVAKHARDPDGLL